MGTGGFAVDQCVTLAQLEVMSEPERLACLLPVESLLETHVRIELDGENTSRFLNGMSRRGDWPDSEQVAVYGLIASSPAVTLFGVGQVKAGVLVPDRLLSPLEIEQVLNGQY